MRWTSIVVSLLASLALALAARADEPTVILFEEAVMEPTGTHLRLRWHLESGIPPFNNGWKFEVAHGRWTRGEH